MLRAFSSVACLIVSLALSGAAAANGRFPRSERLLEDEQDPSHLILGATFGMLVTRDAGATWRHVCEASFAEAGLQTDPVVALTPDGGILAGIYASVARSAPDACDFKKTLGMNNHEAVPDFTLITSLPGSALGVLVSLLDGGGTTNQLFRSDDGGATWTQLGPDLPSSIRTVATIDVAPSRAERVYVSGLDADGAGVLLRSDDGGETFDALAVPVDAAHEEVPYIAAVDADDPDAIYLRTDVWVYDPVAQTANANDALLYSNDGGAHFTELLRKGGKLFGFTFSPDGQQLLVGYGDPVEAGGGRLTDPEALGIYWAPKGSSDFEQRYAGSIGCLTWTAHGLYGCTLEADTGFSLGVTTNTDFALGAAPDFTPLLRLKDVAGPLECPACSSGSICRNYWESSCESWGRTDCDSLIPATPDTCGGASSDGDGATAGESGQGGAPPIASGAPTAGGGCGCRFGRTPRHEHGWWLALLAGGILLRRRFSATARRAARELRFGGSPSCRLRTARARGALRRRDPA